MNANASLCNNFAKINVIYLLLLLFIIIKRQIFEACRAVKPKNFFVNESLTPTRNSCAYGLRQAKKRFPNIVAGYGSLDGKVYVLIKPPNPNAPNAFNSRMWINTKTNFIDLCTKILKCDHTTIVNKWPGDQ